MPSCLCVWIRPTANQVGLLVLQHPMERDQAKGSARLLRLSLARCRCEPGERFDPEALAGWLTANPAGGPVRSLLLFPNLFPNSVPNPFPNPLPQALPQPFQAAPFQPAGPDALAAPGPAVLPEMHTPPKRCKPTTTNEWQLVLLDATWRKARKMLALNPLLQALPRWGLCELPPSRYAIRKAQRPEQRSTLEAACLGLGQLERKPACYDALLSAFDGWVVESAARVPGATSCAKA
jgi:DTW domain-containing protein YfiP